MERLDKSEKIFKVFSYTMVIIFALLALYPVLYAFSVSISGKVAYESGQIVLLPKDVTFQAYDMVLHNKGFWIAYTNTLFYTVLGTAWSMGISLTGAYALQKSKLVFRRQWNFLLVFTMWFSAGMIPLYLNYKNMGVDNRWGMIVAFGVQAYNIILLRNYFSSIPKEIEEAAIVDGANEFQLFGKIYIPMSTASIATVTLFYAISRWNAYYWSRMLLADPYEQPLQVYLRQLIENYQKLYDESPVNLTYSADSLAYAIIICSIVPVLVIYPYIQKYFAKGVNMGGVKG
ncbi:carbohydrate ABC transporter permease [Clostridium sp. chh4-2]|uniref:carbohydrate ABC transporter permease n=1 Tax=Clostridium sp. chh4-2 TaxID=2067550 RepID=UPI000CCE47F4|nr:carbohydrate ABC transporter permease [Clostridium sp. chh4-2]PNV60518.1 carbohydrate ABC transporter permease [Clostridium sp. chh4-2]